MALRIARRAPISLQDTCRVTLTVTRCSRERRARRCMVSLWELSGRRTTFPRKNDSFRESCSLLRTDDSGTPPSNDLPNDICDYLGLIRDQEIDAATNSNFLLIRERIDPARIRQASYELRLSDHVEFLVINEAPQEQATAKYERPAKWDWRTTGDLGQARRSRSTRSEIFNLPTNVVAHVFPVREHL